MTNPAGPGRRALAWTVDVGLAVVAGGWVVLVDAPGRTAWALAAGAVLVLALAQWVLHARLGWTLGRRLVGIRTHAADSRPAAPDDPFGPAYDRPVDHRGAVPVPVPVPVADDPSAAARATPVAAGRPWGVGVAAPLPPRPWAAPASQELPAVTGSLRLAPLAPQRSGPDLDTRALPLVPANRPVPPPPVVGEVVAPASAPLEPSGLDPELELTHRAAPRRDVVEDETVPLTGPETAEIELSDGRRLLVERTALVGRNPITHADVQTVRVHDPQRSVSKTHLQIGVEPAGVWVADRGSTNGTVVTLPGGAQVLCGVDQRVRLRVGAVVVFGDCALRLVRGPGSAPMP